MQLFASATAACPTIYMETELLGHPGFRIVEEARSPPCPRDDH